MSSNAIAGLCILGYLVMGVIYTKVWIRLSPWEEGDDGLERFQRIFAGTCFWSLFVVVLACWGIYLGIAWFCEPTKNEPATKELAPERPAGGIWRQDKPARRLDLREMRK